jgi:hypothetical protein
MQHCHKVICKITKTQGFHPKLGQNLRCNQKAKVSQKEMKKIHGETRKCTNFGVSPNFTLYFYVSFLCTLTIGSLSLVRLDRITVLFVSENYFKL